MFSPTTPLGLENSLPVLSNTNQIQILKASGNQPRPASLSPNVIAQAATANLPAHVTSVQAVAVKANDSTSKVTVSFSRNPNDYFFVDARVFVSGYKGNPAPTQVASGQSPVSFSLENTGEPVNVTVQSSGNLGQAPLSTAPNTTLQLVKTPLATTPTTAGNGTATAGSGTAGQLAKWAVGGASLTNADLSGDVVTSGTTVAKVDAIQNIPVNAGTPNKEDHLFYNGSAWQPDSPFHNIHGFSVAAGIGAGIPTLGMVPITNATILTGAPTATSMATYQPTSGGTIYITDTTDGVSLGSLYQMWTRLYLQRITLTRTWIGFMASADTQAGKLSSATPNTKVFGFRFDTTASDTKWQAYAGTTSAAKTIVNTGVTPDLNPHIFKIVQNAGVLTYYIDGVLVATISTNLPSTSFAVSPVLYTEPTDSTSTFYAMSYLWYIGA